MKNHGNTDFTFSENIPEELKKCILGLDFEFVLMAISSSHKLNENEENTLFELCRNKLGSFEIHTFGFSKKLESHPGISRTKAKILAKEFKEKVLDKIRESLEENNISLDPETENVFYKSGKLKVTDKNIHYSEHPSANQQQAINQVSNITMRHNLLRTNYLVVFEVFIPEKGRWGTVDRPGISFSSEQEALYFKDQLEKAVMWGKFRQMYENIENY